MGALEDERASILQAQKEESQMMAEQQDAHRATYRLAVLANIADEEREIELRRVARLEKLHRCVFS